MPLLVEILWSLTAAAGLGAGLVLALRYGRTRLPHTFDGLGWCAHRDCHDWLCRRHSRDWGERERWTI